MATLIATNQTTGKKQKVYQIWSKRQGGAIRYDWQCDNHEPRFLRFLSIADVVRDAELVLERK